MRYLTQYVKTFGQVTDRAIGLKSWGRVRLSKLEPHVIQPALDNSDVDHFLSEVEEASHSVSESHPGAPSDHDPEQESHKQLEEGVLRFAEFLKKRHLQREARSKVAMAVAAYEFQRQLCPPPDQAEIESLTKYRKYA